MQSIKQTVKSLYCLFVIIHFRQCSVVTAQNSIITPSLTISPAIVIEGNSQTLMCKYNGSQSISDVTWKVNNINTAIFTVQQGACIAISPPEETLYNYTCDVSRSSITLGIKNVKRTNRYDQWRCEVKVPDVSANFISSNVMNPEVKVSIESVSMTLPLNNTVTIKENTPQQFQCLTSGGLPPPTVKWYKHKSGTDSDVEIILSIVTSHSNTTDGLVETTSTLTFSPTKNDHKGNIYCSAFAADQTPKQSTKKPELNVLYGPDGDLTIQGYSDGASYMVIENTPGHLTCLIKGGNPLPTLRWRCYNAGTSDTSDADTVSKTVRWNMGRGQDRQCSCDSTHFSRNESLHVQVYILYPPTTPVFYVQSTKVSGKVKVIRNNSVSINCSSSGKPNQIQYKWTPDTPSSSDSLLNINRVHNDSQYTCHVKNKMDPSDDSSNGDAKTGRNSSLVQVEVLYPPSSPSFRYWNISGQFIQTNSLNVIKDDTLKVACTSEGKPNPDLYQWDTRGNNQLLTVSSIPADQTDRNYKCTVKNSMYETVGNNPTRGSATSTLSVHVMYPPSSPNLYYQYGQEPLKIFTGSFRKIEGNAEIVTVVCNSSSEPQPTFSWNGTLTSNSAILTFANIGRSKAGTYICSVKNEMERTFGNPEKVVRGRNNGNFNLQILYPPVVDDLMNRSVAEGDSLNVSCPVKEGNPSKTTFKWISSDESREWRSQTLTINKVSRNDAKFFYTCEVENEMQETGKHQTVKVPDSRSFHLNVWYAATVEGFYITGFIGKTNVTVNESVETIHFKCNVDSNPGSNITVQNQTEGTHLAYGTNSKFLEYKLNTVTCFDAGLYTCIGSNKYNHYRSEKKLHLFVNCSPRQSPFIQLKENVTSAQHEIAVLSFTAFAYPKPTADDFQWFRLNNTQWMPLSNDGAYLIDTGNLQSNLTVKNVSRSSYGKYKLTVRNTIGDYDHVFHLLPEDKPEAPTHFEHVQELVAETSFTVRWKPGFNNGLDQLFILKYRKVSDELWNIVNITDTGQTQMRYTVSGLSSGTNYEVVIFASNKLGNSSEEEIATITTKARNDPPDIGPLVGGAVGGSVAILLLVVLGFLLIRKFRLTKGKDTSEVELNRRQMDDHDDESSEDEVITENAMYESAGGVVKKNFVDDNVYAKPQKKVKANQDVYAVVNKGKKAGQKKKQKKSKSPKQDTGDIYENAPVSTKKDKTYANSAYEDSPYEDANTASTSKHVKKNADGLIYADLAFNDQPKGQKKLVIHGLDSMTEYVEVDFTKKADPLPDSDTEDQK